MGQVDATITNFLVPLQALVDENSRIHCSLNLNTETGMIKMIVAVVDDDGNKVMLFLLMMMMIMK